MEAEWLERDAPKETQARRDMEKKLLLVGSIKSLKECRHDVEVALLMHVCLKLLLGLQAPSQRLRVQLLLLGWCCGVVVVRHSESNSTWVGHRPPPPACFRLHASVLLCLERRGGTKLKITN